MAVDEQIAARKWGSEPHIEPETLFRVPSLYSRCRHIRCEQPPVADLLRSRFLQSRWQFSPTWWAYCADHLRGYNREVQDGRVWWLGSPRGGPPC